MTSNSLPHDQGAQGESLSPAPAKTADLSLKKSGRRREDYYDVLAGGVVVGRIMLFLDSPTELSWMWTTAPAHHEGRTPTHGYAESREAATQAFAESWHRE